jgi:thymidylate kinase
MIFIEGHTGCGKNTLAKKLIKEFENFHFVDFGPEIIYPIYKASKSILSIHEWAFEHYRRYGKHALYPEISKKLKQHQIDSGKDILITGVRSDETIDYLVKYNSDFKFNPIFFMDVSLDVLFDRITKRNREQLTYKSFLEKIQNEKYLGLEKTKEKSNYILRESTTDKMKDAIIPYIFEYFKNNNRSN